MKALSIALGLVVIVLCTLLYIQQERLDAALGLAHEQQTVMVSMLHDLGNCVAGKK